MFVNFLVEVHGFEGTWFSASRDTGYTVSSFQGYWVRGFELSGYMVSKGAEYMLPEVLGTWFRKYRVHSFEGTGVQVGSFSLPQKSQYPSPSTSASRYPDHIGFRKTRYPNPRVIHLVIGFRTPLINGQILQRWLQ